LLSTITADKASLIGYFTEAYRLLFNNAEECIDTNELIDQLCSEKVMKEELLKKVAENIDEDRSQTITAAEFFKFVIEHLNPD
jgi:Ca2+-binding EF-hand superfamily protein